MGRLFLIIVLALKKNKIVNGIFKEGTAVLWKRSNSLVEHYNWPKNIPYLNRDTKKLYLNRYSISSQSRFEPGAAATFVARPGELLNPIAMTSGFIQFTNDNFPKL
jgi:hypothetical protein